MQAIFAAEPPFDRQKEQVYVLGLNTKHAVKYIDMISMGTLDASLVHPRETFRQAVHQDISCIAIAHNHPSGNLSPSEEEILVTLTAFHPRR